MTFREQYLYGVCEIAQIDACVERWHKTQPNGVSLQAYLGLLDEEYHAFLQPGGNARLAALLNAQRKQLGCRIYQLEFTDTEKTKPFAFSGIDALHKAGFQQPPASEYRLVRDEAIYLPKDEPDWLCWSAYLTAITASCPQTIQGAALHRPMCWSCTMRKSGGITIGI